jgi:hypothetical protein
VGFLAELLAPQPQLIKAGAGGAVHVVAHESNTGQVAKHFSASRHFAPDPARNWSITAMLRASFALSIR